MNMIKEFQYYCRHNLGLAESTITEYGKDLHLFATWLQATAGINRRSQVTRPTVEPWVSSQHCNGTAPATIKRRVSAVRRLYQYAWLQGLCSENPAKYVSTPKNAIKLPNVLQLNDIKAALNDANVGLEIRSLIAVMAEAGLRISEAMRLRHNDFNTTNRSIRITGKGNKERTVYYGDATAQLLEQGGFDGTYIENQADRQIRYEVWQALRNHSNSEKCNPHTLRHTFATTMVENGAELNSLAIMMGHASTKTTERYVHLGSNAIRDTYVACAPNLN